MLLFFIFCLVVYLLLETLFLLTSPFGLNFYSLFIHQDGIILYKPESHAHTKTLILQECSVLDPDQKLSCKTAPGVGKKLMFMARVGDEQISKCSDANVEGTVVRTKS